MNRLLPVKSSEDIPPEYRGTPIGLLAEYHNLGRPPQSHERAELLIGMCMDNRNQLRIPNKFSFIIRSGGANLRYSEFKVSYAIAVGGVRHIALIGHNNCGMVNLHARKDEFVDGLVESGGWDHEMATHHFNHYAPLFEIGNEIDFIITETKRLRVRYPKVPVAPLLYRVEDNLLYFLRET